MFLAWAVSASGLAYLGRKTAERKNISIKLYHMAGLAIGMMLLALLFGWLTTSLYTAWGFYCHQPVE